MSPLPDILEEAQRLTGAAAERSLPIRLLGGLAVRLRAGEAIQPGLTRDYKDIDFVTSKDSRKDVAEFLEVMGYDPDRAFNAFNGGTRLLFHDPASGRQVDVFVGAFAMCHRIPVADRLTVDPLTLPLAELLLTKLQVVDLNEKDLRDLVALLVRHPVADDDGDAINADRVARLCAEDWGLWRTSTMNLDRVRDGLEPYALTDEERRRLEDRVTQLRDRIDAEPKPRSWRLRDRIGDRKRWYEQPEEPDA